MSIYANGRLQIKLDYFYLIGDGEIPLDYFDPHLITDDISVPI